MAVMLMQLKRWQAKPEGREEYEETVLRSPADSPDTPIYEALLNEWLRAGRAVPRAPDPRPVPRPVLRPEPPRGFGGRHGGRAYEPGAPRTQGSGTGGADGRPRRAPRHGSAPAHVPAPAPPSLPPGSGPGPEPSPQRDVRQISPVGPAEPVSPEEPAWERVGTL